MLGRRDRGDTIIEVLLAITIFSLVSVGAMTIMNQGTNAAQRSLEVTLVRQQIDAQAEALRAAQQSFSASLEPNATVWKSSLTGLSTGTWNNDASCPLSAADVNGAFILDARQVEVVNGNWLGSAGEDGTVPPHAQVVYDDNDLTDEIEDGATSYGLWIERIRRPGGDANTPDAYDFRIRACWYGAGSGSEPMNLETIVRLYDPS